MGSATPLLGLRMLGMSLQATASGKEEGGQHSLTSQSLGLGRILRFQELLFAQHLLGAAGRGADLLVQQGTEHTRFLLNLASQL